MDEAAYLERGASLVYENQREGSIIIGGQGYEVKPLTLARLRRIWPVAEKIRIARDPVEVLVQTIRFASIALADGIIERRRVMKALASMDRDRLQQIYDRIMDSYFPLSEGTRLFSEDTRQ